MRVARMMVASPGYGQRIMERAARSMESLRRLGRLTPAVEENLGQIQRIWKTTGPVQGMAQDYRYSEYWKRLRDLARENPAYRTLTHEIPSYLRDGPDMPGFYTDEARDIAKRNLPHYSPFQMARKVVTDGNPYPDWWDSIVGRVVYGPGNAVDKASDYLRALGYMK